MIVPDKVRIFRAEITDSVKEVELNFINENEVEVGATACYHCTFEQGAKPHAKFIKYDYVLSNGVLQIPSLSLNNTFKESGDKYIFDDNTILYKKSIVQLEPSQKAERLNKELAYPKNLGKFLNNEVILK